MRTHVEEQNKQRRTSVQQPPSEQHAEKCRELRMRTASTADPDAEEEKKGEKRISSDRREM